MRSSVTSTTARLLRPQLLSRAAVLPPSRVLSRCLSATPRRLAEDKTQAASKPTPSPAAAEHVNPGSDLPAFSLDTLGLSKNMKIFLFVLLSIFGTIETWIWCKAIWRWWKGETKVSGGEATA